jgi:hypothetical protein
MVRFLLLLLDVQIVVANGLLIPLLLFIYAFIEISLSLTILFKVEVLLELVMIAHAKFLEYVRIDSEVIVEIE